MLKLWGRSGQAAPRPAAARFTEVRGNGAQTAWAHPTNISRRRGRSGNLGPDGSIGWRWNGVLGLNHARTPRQGKELARLGPKKLPDKNRVLRMQSTAGQAVALNRTAFRTGSGQDGTRRDASSWQQTSSVAMDGRPDQPGPTLQGETQTELRTGLAMASGRTFVTSEQ